MLKLLTVAVEVAQTDARTPVLLRKPCQILHKGKQRRTETYSGSERKFEIISSEGVVFNGGFDDFPEEFIVAEKVLCNTKPHPEELDDEN